METKVIKKIPSVLTMANVRREPLAIVGRFVNHNFSAAIIILDCVVFHSRSMSDLDH